MNTWMELVLGVMTATLMAAVLLAAGARLRRLLRLPSPPGLRPTIDLVFGSWLLGSLALLIGLAGAFGATALGMIVIVVAAFGEWKGLKQRLQSMWPLALAALPLTIVAGAPPFFYDAWVYHLGLPWQALQSGTLSAHPENVFAAFPPLAQLIYAFPLSVGVFRAPALLHLVLFLGGAHAVAELAKRLGASRPVSILAGIAVLYLPTSTLVAGLPAAEAWALAGLVAAATLALTGRRNRSAAVLTGLLAGAALAARLQGLPWCALIVGALWLRAPSDIRRPALAAGAAVVGAFPWWFKNAVLLGDPMAPLGWNREGLDTLWRDAGSTVFQAGGWWPALPDIYHALVGVGWLIAPVLLCGLFAYLVRRKLPILLAVGLSITGAILWAGTGSLPRFLIPTLAMGIAAAAALPRRTAAAATLLLLAVGGFGLFGTWAQLEILGGFHVLDGAESAYAAPRPTQLSGNPYPAFRAAETLPDDARVLFVCEPRGFLFPRPFEAGSQHDAPLLLEVLVQSSVPAEVNAALRDRGFSHVLVNTEEQERLGGDYPVLPWRNRDGFHRATAFFASLGEPIVDEAPVKIFALSENG